MVMYICVVTVEHDLVVSKRMSHLGTCRAWKISCREGLWLAVPASAPRAAEKLYCWYLLV